jgi:DNA-binding transcriptional MerR regulator
MIEPVEPVEPAEAASSATGSPAASGDGYRGPQVCKIVGITYRQLDYWARTDLVRPSVADAAGSGTQRLYSYTDLVELKVVKRLLDAGISLQSARKAIEYLRTQLGTDLASAHLVLDGTKTVLASTDDQIVDLLRAGQGVLNVVALGPVVDDLATQLDRYATTASDGVVAAQPRRRAVQ